MAPGTKAPTANAIQAPALKHFFAPDSIALVGATEDPGRFAGRVLLRMMNFGYQGKIYPWSPSWNSPRGCI
jgi:acyl-CoA synthetase (NDP forming)